MSPNGVLTADPPVLELHEAYAVDQHRLQVIELLRGFATFPVLLWALLWAAINTTPIVFMRPPSGLMGYANIARASLGMLVLAIGTLHLLTRADRRRIGGPVSLWFIYGLTGLAAGTLSPRPLPAMYWSANYLAVFVALSVFMQGPNPIRRAVRLNQVSWLAATVVLVALLMFARDVLLVESARGVTGYGVVRRLERVAGGAMSRSSGLSRLAAIPCIVAVVFALRRQGLQRVLWIAVALASAWLVYTMQSRGAMVGLIAALAFSLLFLGPASRRTGATLLVLITVAWWGGLLPEDASSGVVEHFRRGQSDENLSTLTGRTRTWAKAMEHVNESPILGWGPQADRYLLKEHVHNTYLYALLQSGLIGLTLFTMGLAFAWALFLRVVRAGTAQRLGCHLTLIQAGGILAFFTIRSLPEVSGAMFGVDLMLMLPAMALFLVLARADEDDIAEAGADGEPSAA